MSKKMKNADYAESSHLNKISKPTNFLFNIVFIIIALICIIPVVFIFMISISSEDAIAMNGYRFIPAEFSSAAYEFLFDEGAMILRALGISILTLRRSAYSPASRTNSRLAPGILFRWI